MESHNAQIKELKGRMKSLAADNRSLSAELIAAKGERRKYNIVEDMKGKIRVFVRVRPISSTEKERGDTNIISFDEQSKYLLTVDHVDDEKKEQDDAKTLNSMAFLVHLAPKHKYFTTQSY